MGGLALSDRELIDASRRGERDAFGHLVERYQSLVSAVAMAATGDRALSEDVAQETFITAWRQLDKLNQTSKLRPWLCVIARNLGYRARRDRPVVADDAAAEPDGGASPFDAVVEAEAQRIVRDTLSRVPKRYREVLVLYYQNDRSVKEVAEALGISENAALQRLSRGRRYLADSVTDLVERSLADSRPRRSLPAVVVAALPAAAPPRVTTPDGGWNMLKLGLAFTALAATGGTTAYVAYQTHGAEEPAPVQTIAASPVAKATAPSPWREAPALAPAAPAERKRIVVEEPAEQPRIDAATLTRLRLDRGPSQGPVDAPVTIIVFTDFQCDFCGKVLGTIDELLEEYPDQVRLVVKQFPVHSTAVLAAEAALAAEEQDKFWQMHDLMIANQDDLGEEALVEHAKTAGLDVKKFRAALAGRAYRDEVEAEQAAGKEVGVEGTPCFFINGKKFVGAQPIERFRQAIDAELARR
jgi:RNA polymerase sigma factor (sigma-70 family)